MIQPEDLLLDQSAAIGGSKKGNVFKATFKNNGLVAVKVIPSVTFTALRDYVEQMANLKHPNVAEILGHSPEEADPSFLVTVFQVNGNSRQFLAHNPNADRPKIVWESALGMLFLHSRGLIHGSLSPANILIQDDGRACITDCGTVQLQPSNNKDAHRYYSPEAWKGTVSRPSDVFAFAMSALEIFTSTPPWGILNESRIYQLVVQENARPDCPEQSIRIRVGLSDQIWGILEECWRKESQLRLGFSVIVRRWCTHEKQSSLSSLPKPETRVLSRSQSVLRPDHNLRIVPCLSPDDQSTRSLSRLPSYHPVSDNLTIECPSSPEYSSDYSPLPITPPSAHSQRSDFSGYSSVPLDSPGFSTKSIPIVSNGWESTASLDVPSKELPPRSYSFKRHHTLLPHTLLPPISSNSSTFSHPVYSKSSQCDDRSSTTMANPTLMTGALQTEIKNGNHSHIIDTYLIRIQNLAQFSSDTAERFITAGVVPMVIDLLKTRAGINGRLDVVLVTLGALSIDNLTSNTIIRKGTLTTLIEIFSSSVADHISALVVWCLTRLCRSFEAVSAILKTNIIKLLLKRGLSSSNLMLARMSAWCIGNLIWNDSTADAMADVGVIPAAVEFLSRAKSSENSEDTSAALFAVARISRSIKLAKHLATAGVVPIITDILNSSEDPHILDWGARAVGCMMRPNSSDMSKVLLDSGIGNGLARLPAVLHSEDVEPLGSFAFAIQRFSCAEWGATTRVRLVEAGVVDSLLAALRTVAEESCPRVHVELALAVSFLGDIGGSAVRKEIVNAGGIKILKQVASQSSAEVAKICSMAVKSITGNVWTRNTASAKTAMMHNWNGGCPEYQPSCPVYIIDDSSAPKDF